MPNYKTHIAGGILMYICTLFILVYLCMIRLEHTLAIQCFASCLIGSLFPDIDTKSKIQRILYIGMLFVLVLLSYTKQSTLFMALTFLCFIPLIVNHRTLFHRPLFLACIPFGCAFLVAGFYPALAYHLYINALFFMLGAFSHIALDRGPRALFRL